LIHSSISERALARVMAESAARRWRSPFVGRRRQFKYRTSVADHYLAGEGETASIDFSGAGGVSGAQILRRDQQAVG
jgi:hypothetical protein